MLAIGMGCVTVIALASPAAAMRAPSRSERGKMRQAARVYLHYEGVPLRYLVFSHYRISTRASDQPGVLYGRLHVGGRGAPSGTMLVQRIGEGNAHHLDGVWIEDEYRGDPCSWSEPMPIIADLFPQCYGE